MLNAQHAHARRLLAATAWATALSLFVTPLAGIQHEAQVRHVLCLEHGELIDAAPLSASELAAPAHHHARTVAERGDHRLPSAEDSHCPLVAWSHQRSTAAHSGSTAGQPPVAEPFVVQLQDRRPPAIALYRLAPKLSPPLA